MNDIKTQQFTAFDPSVALEQVDGDTELLEEIIQIFMTDHPKTMELISQALKEKNAQNLEHYAHSLKGSAGNFGASATVAAAFKLETIGRSGNLELAEGTFDVLQKEVSKLERELTEYKKAL